MAAAHHHDRVIRRRPVEVVPEWQPLFRQLALVPIAVRDDEFAGFGLGAARGDRTKHVSHGARARKVDAGATPQGVKVVVGEAWHDGTAIEVDDHGFGSAVTQDLVVGSGSNDAASEHGQRGDGAELVVQCVDEAVVNDEVRRVGRRGCAGGEAEGESREQGRGSPAAPGHPRRNPEMSGERPGAGPGFRAGPAVQPYRPSM